MSSRPDTELVEACRRGEEAAWREILQRYRGLVRSTCARAGARGPDIDARTQDVFGEFVRSVHVIRDPKALPRWFITSAHRITLRWSRMERRASGEVPEDLMDTRKGPEAAYADLEIRFRLERAVEKLDPTCQVIIRSLFLTDPPLSYAEVARILGRSESSIGPMRQRCMERLSKLLEEE